MSADREPELTFHYTPTCAATGCTRPPVARITAAWSYGPLRERKNYGLACDQHRDPLLKLAQVRRQALAVGDGEQVGPVELTPLGDLATAPERPPG